MMLNRLIIGAPFGNWLKFCHATSTVGTYTREFRAGPWLRLWRILKTVRYYPGIQAWKNKLGLPNPGLDDLAYRQFSWTPTEERRFNLSDKIISISARTTGAWEYLFMLIDGLRPAAIELNVSCPNCPGEHDATDYAHVFKLFSNRWHKDVIVKLPPVNYRLLVYKALDNGITSFHCCNTIPTPGGGVSGKPLKPFSLEAIRFLRETERLRVMQLGYVIGGGGVTSVFDAQEYLDAGATHIAVASVLFFPWKWPEIRRIAKYLAKLDAVGPPKPGNLTVAKVEEI